MDIKDQFENFEIPVSENMWNEIEGQLPNPKKKRGGWFWLFSIVIGSGTIALISYGILNLDNKNYSTRDAIRMPALENNAKVERKAESQVFSEEKLKEDLTLIQNNTLDKNVDKEILPSSRKSIIEKGKVKKWDKNANAFNQYDIKERENYAMKNENEMYSKNGGNGGIILGMKLLYKAQLNNPLIKEDNALRMQSAESPINKMSNEPDSKQYEPEQKKQQTFSVGLHVARLHNENEMMDEQYEYEGKKFQSRSATAPGENSMGYFIKGSYTSKRYFRTEFGVGLRYFKRADFLPSIWKDSRGNYFARTDIGNLVFDKSILHIQGLAIPAASLEQVILSKYNDAGDTCRLLTQEHVSFLDISVLAGWQFTKNRKLTPYGLAGVHCLIPLSQRASMINTITKQQVAAQYAPGITYKTAWMPTIKLGASCDVSSRLSVDVRAAYTLMVTPFTSFESQVQMAIKTYRFDHFEYWIGLSYRLN